MSDDLTDVDSSDGGASQEDLNSEILSTSPSEGTPIDRPAVCSHSSEGSEMGQASILPVRPLKAKQKMASITRDREITLNLLDLPVDILKDIVKEVTHTNDLTSLALTHSALHRLAIPHIYSRFDIVWPDAHTNIDPRTGVDALTYGLATLVMGEEVFGEAPSQVRDKPQAECHSFTCQECGTANRVMNKGALGASEKPRKRRRGNHFSQFIRKFSLGNGPADWVQEYLVTKEGGKMLGTLVALALARMPNLETFIWDMPTGIVRDVWQSLSYLGEANDGKECKLERVWIRWHDNSETAITNALSQTLNQAVNTMPPPLVPPLPPHFGAQPPPPAVAPSVLLPVVVPTPASGFENPHVHHLPLTSAPFLSSSSPVAGHPSFSILPPLKSLSVLDIDEIRYLDEMRVLIRKSRNRIRELRIGIARHAQHRNWVRLWDGDLSDDTGSSPRSWRADRRIGGVLGTVLGAPKKRFPMKMPQINANLSQESTKPENLETFASVSSDPESSSSPFTKKDPRETIPSNATSSEKRDDHGLFSSHTEQGDLDSTELLPKACKTTGKSMDILHMSAESTSSLTSNNVDQKAGYPEFSVSTSVGTTSSSSCAAINSTTPEDFDDTKLQLETLALERVNVSVSTMLWAFDWTVLTSLTLLHCQNHEQLWRSLRRSFAPQMKTLPGSLIDEYNNSGRRYGGGETKSDYLLNLKRLHTDTVSPPLISFIKDTLPPNTLEVLILQDRHPYSSTVTIDQIFKGPIRHHRGTLKKLVIDSSDVLVDNHGPSNRRAKKWMLPREVITFITSGKMSALRELGFAVDYKDWHYFLRQLPSIPHLRALYVPFIADHVHGSSFDARDLALQIVDIVAIRPDIELCYMGITSKCFEILETKNATSENERGGPMMPHPTPLAPDDSASEDDEDDDDDEVDDEEDDMAEGPIPDSESLEGDEVSDPPDESDDDSAMSSVSDDSGKIRLKLREILFYDDKVTIFKARHGRL